MEKGDLVRRLVDTPDRCDWTVLGLTNRSALIQCTETGTEYWCPIDDVMSVDEL